MKILYVIGNGFDIAHGYDTSYKAFYKYLNTNMEKYPKIMDICDEIYNSKIIDWSDFEHGFGEFIRRNGDKYSILEYKEKIIEAGKALSDFLGSVTSDIINKKTKNDMDDEDNVLLPFDNCEEDDERTLYTLCGRVDFVPSVVCLNYTELCEKYFNGVDVYDVIYLHGRIGYIPIFGVDNEAQLISDNLSIENTKQLSKYFTKNQLVKRNLKATNNDFRKRLEESNLIIIYGTSMGETDDTLWNLIGEKVSSGTLLIYCCYNDYVGTNNVIEYMEFVEEKKKWICNKLKVKFEDNNDRIFIANSQKFFASDFYVSK